MNETRDLARYVLKLKYDDLPREVIEKAKTFILNQLGAELQGSTQPWSQAVYRYAKSLGGNGKSTILNYGDKTTAPDAAFANGTFGHAFEIDDEDCGAGFGHVGSVVVPAVIALGESRSITGKDAILAVVLGSDVMGRLALSVQPGAFWRGFHTMSTVGPLATAAIAGRILGFDEEQVINALGIAGSHSSGIMEYAQTGGSVKRIHGGIAAYGGLRSALLAEQGVTGPPTVLEGSSGFCHAFSDRDKLDRITAETGKNFSIMHIAPKPYPCCAWLFTSIDAISHIVREHRVRPENVEAVIAEVPAKTVKQCGQNTEPADVTFAQMNGPFILALTVAKGTCSVGDVTEENMKAPEILALARKVRLVEADKEFTQEAARMGARVTIKLKGGTSYQKEVLHFKGSPGNPMSNEEIENKFRVLASIVLPRDKVEKAIEVVRGLEELEELPALTALLAL